MNEINLFYLICLLIVFVLGVFVYRINRTRKTQQSDSFNFIVRWNVVLISFILSLSFFGGETYYRFYVDTTDSFGLNLITKRWDERHYQFNNFYSRDNIEYNKQRNPKKRRVTFLGDSFTAGHGIKNVDNRFANIIRDQNADLEIHVMARNGFETTDHYEVLKDLKSQQYDFDLVVLVYNLNDISNLTPASKIVYDRIYSWAENLNYFEKNSYFINTWYFRLKSINDPDIKNYYNYLKDTYFSETWKNQTQQLIAIQQLIEAQNGKLVIITYPFLSDLSETYPFRKAHQHLQSFWKNQNIPHLDLLSTFEKKKELDLTVNPYDAHPNELANKIAAKQIQLFIQDELK